MSCQLAALTLLQLQDIMKILVETRDQQATQNDRQADSARYLNELNSVSRHTLYKNLHCVLPLIVPSTSSGLTRL